MKKPDLEDELIKYTQRKGGPFDLVIVPETTCLNCGATFTKPLRWHYNHDGTCPKCEGRLDPTPAIQQTLGLLKKCKRALESAGI